jgi:hypothetical protein
MTAFTDWLSLQIQAPGALAALVQALSVLLFLLIALRVWRNDRVRRRAAERREIEALAEIADHACDLVVAVSDALGDEVNAHEFAESFERRQLIDADMMLEAIPPQALPSLSLLRPLFELRWTVERSLELADWLVEAIRDAEREGWREAADETRSLAERAAFAADAFRRVARAGHA